MPNLPDIRGKVKIEFSDIEAAAVKAKLLGDTLKRELGQGGGTTAATTALQTLGAGLVGAEKNMSGASASAMSLGEALTSGLGPATAVVAAVVVGLGLALVPVIALLTAFTVGLAGAFTVIGLAAGGVGLLAGGIFLLAQHT